METKRLFAQLIIVSLIAVGTPQTALAAGSVLASLRPAAVATFILSEDTSDQWQVEQAPGGTTYIDATNGVAMGISPITPVHPVKRTFVPQTAIATLPAGPDTRVLEGPASFYSEAGCLGCDAALIMANGQRLDDNRATVAVPAHLVQYVGHMARLTNLVNGKTIVVPITDTGGFYAPKYGYRVADMSVATKEELGIAGGLGRLRVEIL